ncbi:MAG: hypothetical protein HYY50_05730 [Candidatus Kerfeldbacteria bacterium]|nr:hypothetical protein [Candidatus Kerfeldbacteria bacterium]
MENTQSFKRDTEEGYIVVHHMKGDREAMEFLRSTSRIILERLIFEAKRTGQTTFYVKDKPYLMIKRPDLSFLVLPEEKIDVFNIGA